VTTLLAAFVAVGERWRQLDANITSISGVEEILGTDRPTQMATTSADPIPGDPFGGQAVNILITAIDTRSGENASVVQDTMESLLNDVNIVAHISADRTRVDMMSIPRDTLVPLPACQRPDGSTSGAQSEAMINQTFAKGSGWNPDEKEAGVACTVKAIEAVTNIRIDSYILVDFAGFAAVVDGLGGVDVCIPDGLIGTKTPISLEPGMHHLDGATALQVARTRMGKDYNGVSLDGSDLKRINRQQQLIAAVINEALSAATLSRLPDLNRAATAITRALYIGVGLDSVASLVGMAYALRNIDMKNVSLFMVPVVGAGNRVRLAQQGSSSHLSGANAEEVFEALRLDEPVPGTAPYNAIRGGTAGPSPSPTSPDISWTDPGGENGVITAFDAPVTCDVG
jgi:LCP family protein required for cell wall assembly